MKRVKLSFLSLLLCFAACGQQKQNRDSVEERASYTYELVVPDIEVPWGMAFLPDGSLLITERVGKLIHFRQGKKTEIKNLPEIYVRGQGGLLDIQLHPNYPENPWIYLSYASSEGEGKGGHTAIMRAQLDGDHLVQKEVLYKATPNTTAGQHFGSRIVFDEEGYLYFTIGERGEREVNPQNLARDGGKTYRLTADGNIPKDNPFLQGENALKAIYAYGQRNQQGMAVHPETGKIWIHEHGPMGGDEINILQKGGNYGWPLVTKGQNYNGTQIDYPGATPEMISAIHYWTPSIAPSGMVFVTSAKYPHLKGNLLVGSLKFQYLEHDVLEGEKVIKREKLLEGIGRVRSVVQGPDGFIYVGVEGLGIVKLIPQQ